MIGKLLGASLGERLAGRNRGLRGAMIGAATPWLVRRAFTPLGIAALGVERFGQTGNLADLYRTYRLDVDALVEGVAELFLD
jgi:transketolase C-terminal domain/subunit